MKKSNPQLLIFVGASLISLLEAALLFFVLKQQKLYLDTAYFIGLTGLFFIIVFLVFSFIIKEILYNRIKLIYKSIRSVKSNGKHPKHGSLDAVEKEVSDWQKAQQKKINQLKKMEKFRKEYIGNVSHELKTPIFNIQGYLESLTTMEDKDAKIFKSFLNKSLENTKRLHTIVQDLEMISKSETETLELNFDSFNIKELIEQIYDEFDIQAKKQEVSLRFKSQKCFDYKVHADRERIHQVLTNLVSNAIKYNKKQGEVIASCYDMDDHILIEITDTGIGIKQKHLSRLFERFYRVDKNRSRKKGGSGLGLAIVKHLIEAHNEIVHVRSNPGVGTTFGFTLQKSKSKNLTFII